MWNPKEFPLNFTIQGNAHSLNVSYLNFNKFEININNSKYLFTSTNSIDRVIHTKLNSKDLRVSYKSIIDKETGNKIFTIFCKDYTYEALIFNPLISDQREQYNSENDILAPMHGVIKFKNIKSNLKVKKGDTLFNLEAMKMEYSLNSPRDGIID